MVLFFLSLCRKNIYEYLLMLELKYLFQSWIDVDFDDDFGSFSNSNSPTASNSSNAAAAVADSSKKRKHGFEAPASTSSAVPRFNNRH